MGLFNFLGKKIGKSYFEIVSTDELYQSGIFALAIHTAISYISNTISKCEIKTIIDGKDNINNKWYYLFNVAPNNIQSSSEFWNKVIERYFYDSEVIVVSLNDALFVADDFYTDKVDVNNYIYKDIVIDTLSLSRFFKAEDILHFKLDDKSVFDLSNRMNSSYGDMLDKSISNYKKRNGSKFKIKIDSIRAGDSDFESVYNNVIKNRLKDFLENDNAIFPEFKGFELEEFQQASNSSSFASNSDIINMRKDIFEIVAQAFKVPIQMLMGNVVSTKEVFNTFLTTCIDPIANMLSEELTKKTISFDRWLKGDRMIVDTSNIKHSDVIDVASNVDKLIASGVCSVDEIRSMVGLNPLNEDFSNSHFLTKNYDYIDRYANSFDSDS